MADDISNVALGKGITIQNAATVIAIIFAVVTAFVSVTVKVEANAVSDSAILEKQESFSVSINAIRIKQTEVVNNQKHTAESLRELKVLIHMLMESQKSHHQTMVDPFGNAEYVASD